MNKYLPFVILYFFFNSFALPQGLLYTSLLTPLFIIWLYQYPVFKYIWLFFIVTIPFMLVHFLNGVDAIAYFQSYLLLFSVYVFGLAFYQFLRSTGPLGPTFQIIAGINGFFVILAILLLFTPFSEIMWLRNTITNGTGETYRLKLLTYEPSYYSTLFMPIALYYYLKIFFQSFPNKLLSFFVVTVPLLLSLSFGVILGMGLSILFLGLVDKRLWRYNPKLPIFISACSAILVTAFIVMIIFFPDNVVFVRIGNIIHGRDASFNGRTSDSFYLGWKVAAQKSWVFGAGPGQIKVMGIEIFKSFYQNDFTPGRLSIPNSIGDVLAKYGVLGVVLKIAAEVYFFFKTRTNTNYYRLALFIFIFIYQFTGSFITNIIEYVIWILAFYPAAFPEFDRDNIFSRSPSKKMQEVTTTSD